MNVFHTPYYHGLMRKVVVGFGALFSEIKVPREDNEGVVKQIINVPLAYGPKEKHFVRVDQDPTLENQVYVSLPRMGFEITGYSYDPTRMVNRNNVIKCFKDGALTHMYSPVPYNLDISLYVLTKGTEDGLAIVEQILPLFSPEYNLNLNAIPEMNVKQDIPVILNGVSVQDDYEGDFPTRRLVTHTFNFTAKMNLYGPIKSGKIITRTDVDIDTHQLNKGEVKLVNVGDLDTGAITSTRITNE